MVPFTNFIYRKTHTNLCVYVITSKLPFADYEAEKMILYFGKYSNFTQCILYWSLISINKEHIWCEVHEKLFTFAGHLCQNAENSVFSDSKHVYIYYLYSFHAHFLGYKMQDNMN